MTMIVNDDRIDEGNTLLTYLWKETHDLHIYGQKHMTYISMDRNT